MNERAKTLFNDAVQYFCLVVALRVICRAHPRVSPTQAEQLLPKVTQEKWILVGHQALRNSVYLSDNIDE